MPTNEQGESDYERVWKFKPGRASAMFQIGAKETDELGRMFVRSLQTTEQRKQ
jgi:hypothetical protein